MGQLADGSHAGSTIPKTCQQNQSPRSRHKPAEGRRELDANGGRYVGNGWYKVVKKKPKTKKNQKRRAGWKSHGFARLNSLFILSVPVLSVGVYSFPPGWRGSRDLVFSTELVRSNESLAHHSLLSLPHSLISNDWKIKNRARSRA